MPLNIGASLVEIRQYDQQTTQTEKYFREPKVAGNKSYKDPIYVEAQVNMGVTDRRVLIGIGDDVVAAGYIIINKSDLDELGVELKPGDLITKINDKVVDYKIISISEEAELLSGSYYEPTLVLAAFVNNKHKVGGVY